MEHMELTRDGDVFVLRLTDGDNRFNDGSVAEWNAVLDEVEASEGPAALVTTGTGKFYSNGLDLDALMAREDTSGPGPSGPGAEGARSGDGAFIPDVIRLFGRMLRLPVITVAAVNGHAFAAGMMMALAHDLRVTRADRGFWCLPEADLGMPLADGMNDLIVAKLAPQVAHEAIMTARRYGGDEAAARGIADEAVAEDEVLPRAVALAAEHATKDRGAVVALRTRLHADLIATLERGELP